MGEMTGHRSTRADGEVAMPLSRLFVVAAVGAIVLGGIWVASVRGIAGGHARPPSIDTNDLHLKTDVRKLPAQVIEDIN
jgi:hypothetical protein